MLKGATMRRLPERKLQPSVQNSEFTVSLFLFAATASYFAYLFHSLAVKNFVKEVIELVDRIMY